jgi:hypothetical protein
VSPLVADGGQKDCGRGTKFEAQGDNSEPEGGHACPPNIENTENNLGTGDHSGAKTKAGWQQSLDSWRDATARRKARRASR